MKRFFIVGCPRSGTTLLQALLNRHPQIAIPPETKLFCHFHGQSLRMRGRCLDRVSEDLKLDRDELPNPCDTGVAETLTAVQDAYVARIGRPDVTAAGEKTPEHTSELPAIRQAFPDAPIFIMVRNGFDVAKSFTAVPWLNCNMASGGYIWRHYMQHVTSAVDCEWSNVYVIRYESLVVNPIAELGHLFEILQVKRGLEAQCLEPNRARDAPIFPSRERPWKSGAVGTIQREKIFGHQQFSHREIRQVIAACGSMLKRWGYWDFDAEYASWKPTLREKIYCMASVMKTFWHLPFPVVKAELRRRMGRVTVRMLPGGVPRSHKPWNHSSTSVGTAAIVDPVSSATRTIPNDAA